MSHAFQISQQEKEIARDFLSNKKDLSDSSFYKDSLKRNQDLLFLPSFDQFVIVGAGALPSTALCLHDLQKVRKVTLLDVDEEAVRLGRDLLHKLGIDTDYEHCSGEDFRFDGFDGAYIANLVQGKKEVVESCSRGLKKGAWMVLRLTTAPVEGIDPFSIQDVSHHDWDLRKSGEVSECFSSQNYFFQKL